MKRLSVYQSTKRKINTQRTISILFTCVEAPLATESGHLSIQHTLYCIIKYRSGIGRNKIITNTSKHEPSTRFLGCAVAYFKCFVYWILGNTFCISNSRRSFSQVSEILHAKCYVCPEGQKWQPKWYDCIIVHCAQHFKFIAITVAMPHPGDSQGTGNIANQSTKLLPGKHILTQSGVILRHDDVIKWKHFPC